MKISYHLAFRKQCIARNMDMLQVKDKKSKRQKIVALC